MGDLSNLLCRKTSKLLQVDRKVQNVIFNFEIISIKNVINLNRDTSASEELALHRGISVKIASMVDMIYSKNPLITSNNIRNYRLMFS